MAESLSAREPYITPETRAQRVESWLRRLEGLRGRNPLPPLGKACLLLLDLQRLFLDPTIPSFLPVWPAAQWPCAELLEAFRLRHRPVVWTRHVSDADSGVPSPSFGRPLRADDVSSLLAPDWAPRESEPVITKHQYSAWTACDLNSLIPPTSPIILAGVTTNRCVLATAIDAVSQGRVCVVAADACAAANEALQESALAVLASGFAWVASTSEILRALGEGGAKQ